MDTKAFEYQTVKGVIRGQITPITNRSELIVKRIVRILFEIDPTIADAVNSDVSANPDFNYTSVYIWRFTNLSRVVAVEGLPFPPFSMFMTKDEVKSAWECYAGEDPGFWEYLGEQIQDMDRPDVPDEARPDKTLTEAQKNDPNSTGAESTTTSPGAKKSKRSSGGDSKPGTESSSIITTGMPS